MNFEFPVSCELTSVLNSNRRKDLTHEAFGTVIKRGFRVCNITFDDQVSNVPALELLSNEINHMSLVNAFHHLCREFKTECLWIIFDLMLHLWFSIVEMRRNSYVRQLFHIN